MRKTNEEGQGIHKGVIGIAYISHIFDTLHLVSPVSKQLLQKVSRYDLLQRRKYVLGVASRSRGGDRRTYPARLSRKEFGKYRWRSLPSSNRPSHKDIRRRCRCPRRTYSQNRPLPPKSCNSEDRLGRSFRLLLAVASIRYSFGE